MCMKLKCWVMKQCRSKIVYLYPVHVKNQTPLRFKTIPSHLFLYICTCTLSACRDQIHTKCKTLSINFNTFDASRLSGGGGSWWGKD